MKAEQEVPSRFPLAPDEGTNEFETDVLGGAPRLEGAYHKNIERKMLLKERHVSVRCVFLAFAVR